MARPICRCPTVNEVLRQSRPLASERSYTDLRPTVGLQNLLQFLLEIRYMIYLAEQGKS